MFHFVYNYIKIPYDATLYNATKTTEVCTGKVRTSVGIGHVSITSKAITAMYSILH